MIASGCEAVFAEVVRLLDLDSIAGLGRSRKRLMATLERLYIIIFFCPGVLESACLLIKSSSNSNNNNNKDKNYTIANNNSYNNCYNNNTNNNSCRPNNLLISSVHTFLVNILRCVRSY